MKKVIWSYAQIQEAKCEKTISELRSAWGGKREDAGSLLTYHTAYEAGNSGHLRRHAHHSGTSLPLPDKKQK
jgi:hypothetical protein